MCVFSHVCMFWTTVLPNFHVSLLSSVHVLDDCSSKLFFCQSMICTAALPPGQATAPRGQLFFHCSSWSYVHSSSSLFLFPLNAHLIFYTQRRLNAPPPLRFRLFARYSDVIRTFEVFQIVQYILKNDTPEHSNLAKMSKLPNTFQ